MATTAHHATLRHLPGLAAVLALIAAMLLIIPLLDRSYGWECAMAAVVGFFAWRFHRMQLVFTEESLIYRGWFRRYELPYANIERVTRPADKGWPTDRWCPPSVYEVRSGQARVRINLLWFGPSGSRAFHDRFLTPTARHAIRDNTKETAR